ncbi:DnaT-like ssDNA-binding domain-containing protein [Alteromonas sp. AMM-1]|uniref:DnaT-like ssDNA-binding domain-containing protein n=1 Tax=Alteromonas sp. AMM-1 TaxID=3394233 RepID=UPI0039A64BEC
MYTQAEINALTSPLSNDARVLYCLGLRPSVNTHTLVCAPLQYKSLLSLVNGNAESGPYTRGRDINQLIEQLLHAGLVTLPESVSLESSLNGERILLPLVQEHPEYAALHQHRQAMHPNWQPHVTVFNELAGLIGLIDTHFEQEDTGEFVAYWLGRPETVLSTYQWTQKFVHALKTRRTAKGYQAVKKVGNQIVKVEAGIEADDNARKLVAKYANKSNNR